MTALSSTRQEDGATRWLRGGVRRGAIVTVAFALIGLAGRNATSDAPEPVMAPASYDAGPAGSRSTEEEAV